MRLSQIGGGSDIFSTHSGAVGEEAGEFPAELFDFVAVRGDEEAFESPDLDCRVVFFMIICEMALQGIRGPEHQSIQGRASWSDRQFQHLQQRYPAADETHCIELPSRHLK